MSASTGAVYGEVFNMTHDMQSHQHTAQATELHEDGPAHVRAGVSKARQTMVEQAATTGKPHRRAAVRYLVAAAACGAFALIYAQFGHGVYSPFMTFMFAIPLLGGALVALALHLARVRPLPRATRQAWALALASLTVASCLRGIFDIAGTASPYLVVYLAAAGVCAVVALVAMKRA